jgi:hypothetical protein
LYRETGPSTSQSISGEVISIIGADDGDGKLNGEGFE